MVPPALGSVPAQRRIPWPGAAVTPHWNIAAPVAPPRPRAVLGALPWVQPADLGVTVAWATPALLPPSGTARSPAAPGQQEGLAVPGDALGSSCCRGNSCGETGGGGLGVMQVARDLEAPLWVWISTPGPLPLPFPLLLPSAPSPWLNGIGGGAGIAHTHTGGARGCICTGTYVHMLTLLPGTPSPH